MDQNTQILPNGFYISISEITEPEPRTKRVSEYPKITSFIFSYKIKYHQPHSNPGWIKRVKTLLPPYHTIFYVLFYIIVIYDVSKLKYSKCL